MTKPFKTGEQPIPQASTWNVTKLIEMMIGGGWAAILAAFAVFGTWTAMQSDVADHSTKLEKSAVRMERHETGHVSKGDLESAQEKAELKRDMMNLKLDTMNANVEKLIVKVENLDG